MAATEQLRAYFITSRQRQMIIVCAFSIVTAIALTEQDWGDDSVINCQEIGPVAWIEKEADADSTRILN